MKWSMFWLLMTHIYLASIVPIWLGAIIAAICLFVAWQVDQRDG